MDGTTGRTVGDATGPRIASLCTGYGGLDIAVQQIYGGEVVVCAENDKHAARIVAHHYPNVPNVGDIKTVDWSPWVGGIDILTAGYPCQPFSHAGKMRGEDDPRHIWPHVAQAIRELGPRLVVLENVRGHLRLGFGRVIRDLADLGYVGRWGCLRAAEAGACHRRERVFIVAWPVPDPHVA
jgi:DNA (cytosine-5)-methyltransferase 1